MDVGFLLSSNHDIIKFPVALIYDVRNNRNSEFLNVLTN